MVEIDAEVAVVGAGVVGLAVAATLSSNRSVVVIERHEGPARETSSHNSQVVHAGIFYQTGSLKHLLCLEGNRLLYDWCEIHQVDVRRDGKLIVAVEDAETGGLDNIEERARTNGVPDISRLSGSQARALESAVPAVAGLHSRTTGVVDAFGFARSLETSARDNGALFAYLHDMQGAEREVGGFRIDVNDPDGDKVSLRCAALVNSAGHGAPALAQTLGYPIDGGTGVPSMRHYLNRGRYYDLVGTEAARMVSRPVYPVPPHTGDMPEHLRRVGGLGVHITVDTDGVVRLGPDAEWLPDNAPLDYRTDDNGRSAFLEAGRRLLPNLRDEDIAPGQVGYRPKLQAPGEDAADFLVWEDSGYVHLGGIESPGLTASLAIARMVSNLLR